MNELSIVRSDGLMPALSIDEAVSRYKAVVEFTKRVMKSGKDYGIIPGTGDKPTLLKPGAEKLCSLFGLVPEFEPAHQIVDFDKGLFYFQYCCKLYRNGALVATGLGSCNNREKKYRYRNIPENRATDEEKAIAIRVETKNGKFGKYKVYVIENTEPYDLINTLDKMAQKRALIAATLIAANASDLFTQDLDDLVMDAEYHEVNEKEQPKDDHPDHKAWEAWSKLVEEAEGIAGVVIPAMDPNSITTEQLRQEYKKLKLEMKAAAVSSEPAPNGNGNDITGKVITAAVEAGLSENEYSARQALKHCKVEFASVEDGLDWMRRYRGFRDLGGSPEQAAEKANAGKQP